MTAMTNGINGDWERPSAIVQTVLTCMDKFIVLVNGGWPASVRNRQTWNVADGIVIADLLLCRIIRAAVRE